MVIQQICLSQYRNYPALTLQPPRGCTVLTGDNAQGKTNLLEALFFGCIGRSHRTSRDRELIAHGQESARINLAVEQRDGIHTLEIKLTANRRKTILINGHAATRMAQMMGHLNAVLFAPEDLALVKNGPGERRRMLDMAIAQVQPTYFEQLGQYQRALDQRNTLLRQARMQPPEDMLTVWDEALAEHGAQVIQRRARYLQELAPLVSQMHAELSGCGEELLLHYRPSVAPSQADSRQTVLDALQADRRIDCQRGMTHSGPHRDDFELLIQGRPARVFASQGQQRTAALAIKLAQLQCMEQAIGEAPVLLLDDVLSELDEIRQGMLLDQIGHMQTFITCTRAALPAQLPAHAQLYGVENGVVIPICD